MNTVKIKAGNTKMIAHRGVSGLEKENTNLAFVAAGNRSYFGVETDVHYTADKGKYVLIHDSDTCRLSAEHYVIEQTDFETLRKVPLYDVDKTLGRVDLHMPTPEEYLQICKKYEKYCILELKNNLSKEDVANLVELWRKEDYLDHLIIISFEYLPLVAARELLPEQPIQYLCRSLSDDVMERVRKHHFDIDIEYRALTEEIVKKLHEEGIKINCWTVNDPADGQRLADWGVDFITSNILEAE